MMTMMAFVKLVKIKSESKYSARITKLVGWLEDASYLMPVTVCGDSGCGNIGWLLVLYLRVWCWHWILMVEWWWLLFSKWNKIKMSQVYCCPVNLSIQLTDWLSIYSVVQTYIHFHLFSRMFSLSFSLISSHAQILYCMSDERAL